MNFARAFAITRWVIAGVLCAIGAWLLLGLPFGRAEMGPVVRVLYGFGAIGIGVLTVGPEIVRLAVAPLSNMLDRILMPSESAPVPLDFTLARFYHSQHRYAEACEEYEKIIQHHPEATTAYLEGIQAAALAEQPDRARKFYRAAQRVVHTDDERNLLNGVYNAQHILEEATDEEEAFLEAQREAGVSEEEARAAAHRAAIAAEEEAFLRAQREGAVPPPTQEDEERPRE